MPETSFHSEQQLLALLKKGDQQAFTQLYHRYSERIYLNLLRLLKSTTLAEELLQEIFITLWEKRGTISVHSSFNAYLQRVAENKAVDFFRKARRDRKLIAHLHQTDDNAFLYPGEFGGSAEQSGRLRKALESLPPQRQQVFVFCKLEGKSYREVSRLLGISPSTINDHIVKATRSIRQFLDSQKTASILVLLFAALAALL